ncbi:hypothetical protein KGM_212802 [Danaus plexippus plexippus]|uniref:Uncharacterized protein n=1 Tax=Danaus plexippus plexippus TaxID=278856 RepID=A0A212F6E8_DANPL|nr:hypothetical protein KGM_212802 [Danaus plexippus plexippus]
MPFNVHQYSGTPVPCSDESILAAATRRGVARSSGGRRRGGAAECGERGAGTRPAVARLASAAPVSARLPSAPGLPLPAPRSATTRPVRHLPNLDRRECIMTLTARDNKTFVVASGALHPGSGRAFMAQPRLIDADESRTRDRVDVDRAFEFKIQCHQWSMTGERQIGESIVDGCSYGDRD